MQATYTEPEVNRPSIDLDELLGRCVGRFDILGKLLASFDEMLPPQCEQLEQAIHSGDMERTKSLAHRLRGAALTVSAYNLSKCAERLETCSSHPSAEELESCLDAVRRECDRLSATVRIHLGRN